MKFKYNKVYIHKRDDGIKFLIYLIKKRDKDGQYETFAFSSLSSWKFELHDSLNFIKQSAAFINKRNAIVAVFGTSWKVK